MQSANKHEKALSTLIALVLIALVLIALVLTVLVLIALHVCSVCRFLHLCLNLSPAD